MLLDSQNIFRDNYMKPLQEGKEVILPEGYAAIYEEWAEENSEILYKLSPEERTESFADKVDNFVTEKLNIIAGRNKDMKKRVNRGEVILASTDNGDHFDTAISMEQIPEVSASSYVYLTSSFRTATTNLKELVSEQRLLKVVKKLKDQHYLVKSASIENGEVQVEVVHPRRGAYTVAVDLDQDITKVLIYRFIDATGNEVKRFDEGQLPESYDEISPDESRLPLSERALNINMIFDQSEVNDDSVETAKSVGMAAKAVMKANAKKAMQRLNNIQNLGNNALKAVANRNNAIIDGLNNLQNAEQEQTYKPMNTKLSNVMDNRLSVKNRAARQNQEQTTGKKHQKDRNNQIEKQNEETNRENRGQKYANSQARQPKKKKGGGMIKAMTGLGTGGALLAGGGITGFLILFG